MQETDIDDLQTLIKNNMYIQKAKSNKVKDFNSLSYVVDMNLSQSDCIKLGNGIEKLLIDVTMNYTQFENIKDPDKKGVKQKDHLFADHKNKIVYYAELKANINLDTEKSKATCDKCTEIVEELMKTHPEYDIKWCLLAYRYLDYDQIPTMIKNKYNCRILGHLFGINEYFKTLDIPLQFTKETYKQFINSIATAMFAD